MMSRHANRSGAHTSTSTAPYDYEYCDSLGLQILEATEGRVRVLVRCIERTRSNAIVLVH